jgi:hypothetical protein
MLNTDAKILVEAIKNAEYDLNDWEMGFMSSIEEQVDKGRHLSKKQGDLLQAIYRKTQGGGIYMDKEKRK